MSQEASQSSTLQRGLNTRHIRFLALGSATQGLVVPKTALRHEQNQDFIWIIETNNQGCT
mgnify:CR=1 FL=1